MKMSLNRSLAIGIGVLAAAVLSGSTSAQFSFSNSQTHGAATHWHPESNWQKPSDVGVRGSYKCGRGAPACAECQAAAAHSWRTLGAAVSTTFGLLFRDTLLACLRVWSRCSDDRYRVQSHEHNGCCHRWKRADDRYRRRIS